MPVIPENIINDFKQTIDKEFITIPPEEGLTKYIEIIERLIDRLYDNIDDKKRISYGITYAIKTISKMLYDKLSNPYSFAARLYNESKDFGIKNVGLSVLSFVGIKQPDIVLPVL